MSTRLTDRRKTRIAYEAPVDIVDRHGRKKLRTKGVDLSRGGIRLETNEMMEVGTPLTCQLRLGKDRTFVPGRVVWSGESAEATGPKGLGVEFVDLSNDEQKHLRSVVGEPEPVSHLVDVEFAEGILPGRVRRTKKGLQLDLKCGFLKKGNRFGFEIEENGKKHQYHGVVGHVWSVREKKGFPIVSMDVDVRWNPAPYQFKENEEDFHFDGELDIESETEIESPVQSRGLSLLSKVFLVLIGIVAMAFLLAALLVGNTKDEKDVKIKPEASFSKPVKVVAKKSNMIPLPNTVLSPVVTKQKAEPKRFDPKPSVKREGNAVYVSIPVDGTTKGATYYRLAKPDAVGVNLPNASSEKPESYVFHKHNLRLVKVRKKGNGSHVRVFFEEGTPKYQVEMMNKRLLIKYNWKN